MSRTPLPLLRQKLIAKGLIDVDGNVTPAGDEYTDELIAKLKRGRNTARFHGRRVNWRPR